MRLRTFLELFLLVAMAIIMCSNLQGVGGLECFTRTESACNGTLVEDDVTDLNDCCVSKAGQWYRHDNTTECEECIHIVVGFEETSFVVSENAGTVKICVSILEPKQESIDVEFQLEVSTTDQTATAFDDYTPLVNAPLEYFNDSNRRQCFKVVIVNDKITELEEKTFSVSLSKPSTDSNYYPQIEPSEATITIRDNDYVFGFEHSLYEVSETAKNVEVCVLAKGPPLIEPFYSLPVVTINGTSKSGIDYKRTVKRLSFRRGGRRKSCFQIPLLDDNKGEKDKFFFAHIIQQPEEITLSPQDTMITITDDDLTNVFGFEHNEYHTNENSGSVEVCVVHKSGALSYPVTISVCTVAGDAIAVYDYQSVVLDITFDESSDSKLCGSITLVDNHYPEKEKAFQVTLISSDSGTLLDQPNARIVISDDDTAPVPKNTCSVEDLQLTAALGENQRQVVESIAPILFPDMTASPNATVPLADLYQSLSTRANRTTTEAGFSRFVEAVDEITASYVESCVTGPESLRPDINNVPDLVEQFREAFQGEKLAEIRSLYGKMLCLNDQLSNVEPPTDSGMKRKRRQLPQCILDRTCTAESYCSRPRLECNCPAGEIDSPEIFCPCEFFDCLDEGDQLQPIFLGFFGAECLAFVVDTSGSMKDEIDFTVQVIKDFLGSEEELGCYMLVPFNDDGVSPETSVAMPTLTVGNEFVSDLQGFVSTLEDAFQPDSGGDCPEYSYNGVMTALETLLDDPFITEFGSQVIVLTDAPSKGPLTANDLIDEARLSEVCIHFFLAQNTFNCFEDFPGSVDEYRHIADETGGTVVDTDFDFSSFVQAYKNTPCKFLDQSRRRRKRAVVEGERCHVFRVSVLASLLKLTVKTSSLSVTVHRPDGSEKTVSVTNPTSPGEKLAIFSEVSPQSGEWTACVETGTIEIFTEVEVVMDVSPFYFAQDDSNTTFLTATPPPGCTASKIALSSSQSGSIYSSTVQLLDDDGEVASEAVLDKCGMSWTGSITTPAASQAPYTYQINGQDIETNPFVYFTQRTVSFSSGEQYFQLYSESNEDLMANIGDFVSLSFTLTSTNPYGSSMFQFMVEELDGFSRAVQPQQSVVGSWESLELIAVVFVTSSQIQSGSAHNVTVTASNGCISVSATRRIVLTAPPTMPPVTPSPGQCDPPCQNGGTCVIIERRNRQIASCRCTSEFRGRGCETPR